MAVCGGLWKLNTRRCRAPPEQKNRPGHLQQTNCPTSEARNPGREREKKKAISKPLLGGFGSGPGSRARVVANAVRRFRQDLRRLLTAFVTDLDTNRRHMFLRAWKKGKVLNHGLRAERQKPHSGSRLVNHDQRTNFQLRLVVAKHRNHERFEMIGRDVLSPNLDDAGAVRLSNREHCAEVKIVGEYYVAVSSGPGHDDPVFGPRIAHRRPVDSVNPMARKQGCNPAAGSYQ